MISLSRTEWSLLFAISLVALLSGCIDRPMPAVTVCPSLVTYNRADQKALASELGKDGPIAARFLADYGALRDQVRACIAAH